MTEIEIDFYPWNLDEAHKGLQEAAVKIGQAFADAGVRPKDDIVLTFKFNGQKIKSSDSIDECYQKITGKTKEEYSRDIKKAHDEYERREKEWQKNIPSRVQPWCDVARGVIREDKYDYWDEIVPIRLGDLYHGMELSCTIEILKEWNESHDTKKCYKIIDSQGHSGMSHGLVSSMVREFAKGTEEEVNDLYNAIYG